MISVHARMFQRNTTPLFGSGLIDQVTGKQLKDMAQAQEKHPEISGRPATRPDGRYGRFGWRGNIATLLDFCDQACAAEVGLETARKPQPMDPTAPGYQNPSVDISDNQIRAMKAFVSALPAPVRQLPQDSETRHAALRGEQLFATVGCSVCHVPNMGPARGLYSDLLLHDMGYESIDLNPADPYIRRATPVSRINHRVTTTTATTEFYDDALATTYYGSTSVMSGAISSRRTSSRGSIAAVDLSPITRRQTNIRYSPYSYEFRYPQQPDTIMRFVPLGSKSKRSTNRTQTNRTSSQENPATIKNWPRAKTLLRLISLIGTTRSLRPNKPTMCEFTSSQRITCRSGEHRRCGASADSAPYMHDGRAATLLEAVSMHDGEGAGTRDRFLNLSHSDRSAIITFMKTLVAPVNVPQANL